MVRVLLAWEVGDGLGHVTRLLPIARRLKQEGVECVLAIRDVATLFGLGAADEFLVLQAPVVIAADWARTSSVSGFSDILGIAGFEHPDRLRPAILGWDNLLRVVRPDLVIADFSPVLCLAMSGGTTPLVVVGDGFTLPPVGEPSLPRFRDVPPVCSEAQALGAANAVLAERGRPPLARLSDLFAGAAHYVVTLPELDPHAPFRGPAALGPLDRLPARAARPPTKAWYAYLSQAHHHTRTVLEGLASSGGGEGALFLRDAGAAEIAAARAMGLTVHNKAPPLSEAAAESEVVIHHGGLGTAQAALALGRVQLLVPRQLEQRMNGRRLGVLGVAVAVAGRFRPADLLAALDRARTDARLRDAAARRADAIAARDLSPGVERLVRESLALVRDRAGPHRVAATSDPGYRG